jgi:glycine/D-amino acid oxidase-like deaminating enzyme
MPGIVVIGSGVVGLSTALMLAGAGHDVTVLERDAVPLHVHLLDGEPLTGPAGRGWTRPSRAGLPRSPPARWQRWQRHCCTTPIGSGP